MRQNVTPDGSNHIKDILSSDQEKKLLKSLQSIPSNAREDHAMLEKLVKKLGWYVFYWHGFWDKKYKDHNENTTLKTDSEKSRKAAEDFTGIPIVQALNVLPLVKTFTKPVLPDGTQINQRREESYLPGDSNTYLLKNAEYVMKLYFCLSKQDILAYHKFQNQLTQSAYSFDYTDEISGQEFQRVEFTVLPLPENQILWTDASWVSFVPYSGHQNLQGLIKNDSLLFVKIMEQIQKTHGISNFPTTIHPQNVQLVGIENGVASFVLTDIWDNITELLESQWIDSKHERISLGMIDRFKQNIQGILSN